MKNSILLWQMFISVLTVCGVEAPHLLGQERSRTFAQCKCRYTLPDETWSWIAKPPPRALFAAENDKGLIVTFAHVPFSEPVQLDDEFVQEFESEIYGPGKFTKRSGRFLIFNQLRSYQTEGTISEEKTIAARICLANGASYQLIVIGGSEPIEKDLLFDKIMSGFEFTEPPSPMTTSTTSAPDDSNPIENPSISRQMGRIAFWCMLGVIVLGAIAWGFRRQGQKPV